MRRVTDCELRTFCLDEGETFHADVLGRNEMMSKDTDIVNVGNGMYLFEHVGCWDGRPVDDYRTFRVSDTGEHRYRVRKVRFNTPKGTPYKYEIERVDGDAVV